MKDRLRNWKLETKLNTQQEFTDAGVGQAQCPHLFYDYTCVKTTIAYITCNFKRRSIAV